MVLGLRREVADDILTLFIAILYFQSIPKFQIIGDYFVQYPWIIFGIATLLLIKRKAIIETISS